MTTTHSRLGRLLYENDFSDLSRIAFGRNNGTDGAPWYAEPFLKAYPYYEKPADFDKFANIVGSKLDDTGHSRIVWNHRTDPKLVVKTGRVSSHDKAGSAANSDEAKGWRFYRSKGFGRYFAPVRAVSSDKHFLLQERAVPLKQGDYDHDDPMPEFMASLDFHATNFGRLPDGRLVMLDYRHTLAASDKQRITTFRDIAKATEYRDAWDSW